MVVDAVVVVVVVVDVVIGLAFVTDVVVVILGRVLEGMVNTGC